jgi:hypothetical protein
MLTATTNWTPGEILNGFHAAKSVSVPGSALGDPVVVGFSSIQSSQMPIRGLVGPQPGNVTVVLTNNSGVTQDVGNGTLNVVVIKL